ncbi:MAG: energy-coupling factor ABC transporter ATP-binding protein, partial [Treponemataceae bacterium]|nr:energy-coupling factor ABC transporter ATP-binding protein [Treponemataceae bacterium]
FGPKNQKKSKEAVAQAVQSALEPLGLTAKADVPARFLSGGEKRRLAVACMLAMDLPIIIFDEPYANLDVGGVRQVNALIRQLKAQRKTVVVLTHELEKCLGLADRFIVLFRGEKVFDGTPQEGIAQPLEQWNIRNPLARYESVADLVW